MQQIIRIFADIESASIIEKEIAKIRTYPNGDLPEQ